MPYNGSGSFTRPVSAYAYDTVISETDVNAEMDGVATGLSTALTKDGQTTPSANLPMGGYLHSNVGAATARTHYARASQVQDGALAWAGTSGGTDTVTAACSPVITAYAAGQRFAFLAGGTNTGAATLNVNGVGAKAIQKNGAALVAGDITAGDIVLVVYDGTQFQMVSPARTPVLTAGGIAGASVAAASDIVSGVVELATTAETTTGTDAARAVTPDGLHDMTSLAGAAWFLDEDNMASDSAVKVPSQQSVKAYVDTTSSLITAGTNLEKNPIALNSQTTQAHGLGAVPTFVRAELVCLTAELGYSIGDRIEVSSGLHTISGSSTVIAVFKNATNVIATISNNTLPSIARKDTNAAAVITAANWKLVLTPYLVS